MSKTPSISTVYIDPPQFTSNPRKLDIRVDDVALYGAKQVRPTKKSKRRPIRLTDVVEDLAVIKKFKKLEGEVETKIIEEESTVKKELDLEAYNTTKTDDEDPTSLVSDTIVPTRLIVGFDTEYVTKDPIPSNRFKKLSKAEKEALKGSDEFRNEVLSYQYYAILPAYDGTIIKEWSGILYVEPGQRLSRSQFISAVYMRAFEPKRPDEKDYVKVKRLPQSVILVGHFTKVDLPAFSDFKDFKHTLDSVRKSMITVIHDPTFASCPLINGTVNSQKMIFFLLRDTFLLTSSVEQSLASLGKLLNLPKLPVDPADYKQMDLFLKRDRKAYESYAIRDAEIAAKYALNIYANQGVMGLRRDVPPTLSGMGVGLLLNYWMNKYNNPQRIRNPEIPRQLLGQKVLRDTTYVKPSKNNKSGYTRSKKVIVDEDLKHWHTDFTVDCYHGGRNEQYFFGAGDVGHWFDYDLRSAYPTAMSLIPRPNWQKVFEVQDKEYWRVCEPDDLAYFFVEFDFKKAVRFPVLPIRTQYGLIYPLKGTSCCTAAEIVAARNLGAEITQIRCVKAESDKNDRPFKEFILYCIENRNQYPKDSLRRLIWKEMTNGTYGKLAQGLRFKRAYNLRENAPQTLRPSKLTNSFYAAFVTGFVRAALGEIMNALPQSVSFSNCTTDGILCTAPIAQIKNYLNGPIGKLFHENALLFHGEQKLELTGFLEVKSEIKQPLGWKTRGQATLQFLKSKEKVLKDSSDIVLAKAGISTPSYLRNLESDQNEWIIKKFLGRDILTKYDLNFQASTRRIAQQDWDAITFYQEKYLNMEYDWKRCPANIQTRSILGQDHLYFETKPWTTVEEFYKYREAWITYFSKRRESADEANKEVGTLKTEEALKVFLDYVPQRQAAIDAYERTNIGKRKYAYTKDPHRGLKIEICTAFGKGLLGFPKPEDRTIDYPGFAEILNKHLGSETMQITRRDIENNIRRKHLKLGCIPKTPELVRIIENIKRDSGIDFDDSQLWAPV